MLYEIICDKFKKKRIEFHPGLNTVLGTEQGDNSIGKSTFLLIIDFIFGGTDYAVSQDIIKNVGVHDIYFAFKFEEEIYRYARNTEQYRTVWICNELYEKVKDISLDEYCSKIQKKYDAVKPFLTLRNSVGRYIRVYGKDNAIEKLPLNSVPSEKQTDAKYALLKLFDLYMPVHQLSTQAKLSSNELKAYKKAQQYNFIGKITKTQYTKNKKTLEDLEQEISILGSNMEKGFSDLNAEISDEAVRLKKLLSNARRMRSKLKMRLDTLSEEYDYKFSSTTNDFHELQELFPEVNLQKIENVESFHKQISRVFKAEIRVERNAICREIDDYNKIILNYEKQLEELIGNPTISKTILTRHGELVRQAEKLQAMNGQYETLTRLEENKSNDVAALEAIENKQFAVLQNDINCQMREINNYIYNGSCNPPVLNFTKGKYEFFTPDDTGTGIAYKGLVVFDLSVLTLTALPILVHDSIVLKQISDIAIEKILELYQNSNKQVIISLDKHTSYTDAATRILVENSVLNLAPNGNELFGRSWG